MDTEALLFELKQVFEKLDAEIREQPLKSEEGRARSGLVRVRGQRIVFLDNLLSPEEKIKILCELLKGFDLEGVYLSPYVRKMLEVSDAKE
jgi:hypothetical protein